MIPFLRKYSSLINQRHLLRHKSIQFNEETKNFLFSVYSSHTQLADYYQTLSQQTNHIHYSLINCPSSTPNKSNTIILYQILAPDIPHTQPLHSRRQSAENASPIKKYKTESQRLSFVPIRLIACRIKRFTVPATDHIVVYPHIHTLVIKHAYTGYNNSPIAHTHTSTQIACRKLPQIFTQLA